MSGMFKKRRLLDQRGEDNSRKKNPIEPFYLEVVSILNCPVCLGLMTEGSIYCCVNDHLVCHLCWDFLSESNASCPSCRSALRGKSRIAENIRDALVSTAKIPCPNHMLGCQTRVMKSKMDSHLPWCESQQVPCPSVQGGPCKWRGALERLNDHLKAESCALVLNGSPSKRSFTLNLNLLSGRPYARHIVFTKVVLAESPVCLVTLREEEGVFIYLRMVGTSAETKSPDAIISILQMPEEKTVYSLHTEILSADRPIWNIKQSGIFLFLDEAQLMRFHNENRLITVRVTFPEKEVSETQLTSPVHVSRSLLLQAGQESTGSSTQDTEDSDFGTESDR